MSEPIKTTFGFSAGVLSASWYSDDLLESEKEKQLVRHLGRLADVVRGLSPRPLPTEVTARLIDTSGSDIDGLKFRWVTEL